MHRLLSRLVCCAFAASLCLLAAQGRAESRQVFAHVFTVPTVLPEGASASARQRELEAWLSATFGGFTCLGRGTGGWKNEGGRVETQDNVVYLVTAGRDVSKAIAEKLRADFGERAPYVLVIPAGQFVP